MWIMPLHLHVNQKSDYDNDDDDDPYFVILHLVSFQAFLSSFAIILMRKRELVALILLSF